MGQRDPTERERIRSKIASRAAARNVRLARKYRNEEDEFGPEVTIPLPWSDANYVASLLYAMIERGELTWPRRAKRVYEKVIAAMEKP
jgi:hypothetical protein